MVDAKPIWDPSAVPYPILKALTEEETVSLASLDLDGFEEINVEAGGGLVTKLPIAPAGRDAAGAGRQPGAGNGGPHKLRRVTPSIPPGHGLEKAFLQMETLRAQSSPPSAAQAYPELNPSIGIGAGQLPPGCEGSGRSHATGGPGPKLGEGGRAEQQCRAAAGEEMVLRSCYYTTSQGARLKKLAEQSEEEGVGLVLGGPGRPPAQVRRPGSRAGTTRKKRRQGWSVSCARRRSRTQPARSGNCR